MEGKSVFRALVWSLFAGMLWYMIAFRLWAPAPQGETGTATTQPAGVSDTELPSSTTQPSAGAETGDDRLGRFAPAEGTLEEVAAAAGARWRIGETAGGALSPYRMELELSPVGASIATLRLADFQAEVKGPERFRLLQPVEGEGGETYFSCAVEKITIDGQAVDLRGQMWDAEKRTEDDNEYVLFSKVLNGPGGQPALRLTQQYHLVAQPFEKKRYDLDIELAVENLDQVNHQVILTTHGPVGIPVVATWRQMRAVLAAEGSSGVAKLKTHDFTSITKSPEKPHDFTGIDPDNPLWWAGVDNTFFACALAPTGPKGKKGPPVVSAVSAVDLDGSEKTDDDITYRLVTAPQTVAPGAVLRFHFDGYFGPKDRAALSEANPDYMAIGYHLVIERMYTWCTFSWLAELMIWLLGLLHAVVHNYGVAIIILVLVVRVLLHPITKKGQVNMMKMQKNMGKLQPKIAEIKKKYANDKARMNSETMRLYQEEGINPAGQMLTCLPMLLQMPIWVALYTSMSYNIATRHEPFVLWIRDLTSPDALISFGREVHIPLLSWMVGPITALNVLPLLWGVAMFAQQKLMPKPKPPEGELTPQQEQAQQMQKMMPWMSLLFPLFLYNAPSGLTLYILASTVFGTIEQWRIRQHIKELEDRGDADPYEEKPKGPRGPTWWRNLRGQFAENMKHLQKQAEDARRLRGNQSSRRDKRP